MDPNSPPDDANPPAFDKEAARRRYRATMRGPFMRSMIIMLAIIMLIAWGLGIASVFAKDVERLPGHDFAVPPSRCVACHTQQLEDAPPMPHIAFPSCGFCHRQGPAGGG
jgi:hypothetical protein